MVIKVTRNGNWLFLDGSWDVEYFVGRIEGDLGLRKR